MVNTKAAEGTIDLWFKERAAAAAPTNPIGANILSNQRASLANTHQPNITTQHSKGPKALIAQSIEGPSSTKPGTKRHNAIKHKTSAAGQVRKDLYRLCLSFSGSGALSRLFILSLFLSGPISMTHTHYASEPLFVHGKMRFYGCL
jgi:hypothetical protein